MITLSSKGNFNKTYKFLKPKPKQLYVSALMKCGEAGVKALSSATPRDTGKTAESWSYKIAERDGGIAVEFYNGNVVDNWCNVAVILQTGHATGTGGWVEGIDYINPALRPIFDEIAQTTWKEVVKL